MNDPILLARVFEQVGRIAEAQARIEAMKAANERRKNLDEALAYNEEDFIYQADEINSATSTLRDIGRA